MANELASAKVFANAGLLLLKNSLVLAKLCDSEAIDKVIKTDKGGAPTGGKVNVKRPPEFIVRDGAVANPQPVLQGEVEVAIDKYKGVDVEFTSWEETLDVDSLTKSQTMKSAMSQIASEIDSNLNGEVLEFPSWVGTPGELIKDPAQFFAAPERLDELAIPMEDRVAILSPPDGYKMAGHLLANAAQQGSIAKNALEKAEIPILGNTKPYIGQTVASLTTGTRASTGAALIAGAGQDVEFVDVRKNYQQELNLDGLAAGATVKRGEVFSIAGVYAVNPRTKQVLPFLAQFAVLADAVADGAGAITLTIASPIIVSGAYQNVSAAPADNAAVSFMGAPSTTYRQNSAFHKSSLKLVTAKLMRPYSGECEFATDPETGLTIRYWRTSDGTNDTHLHRFDVVFGVKNLDPRLGTRISGLAA